MRTEEFTTWLKAAEQYKPENAANCIARCMSIEATEHTDLDQEYSKDKCASLGAKVKNKAALGVYIKFCMESSVALPAKGRKKKTLEQVADSAVAEKMPDAVKPKKKAQPPAPEAPDAVISTKNKKPAKSPLSAGPVIAEPVVAEPVVEAIQQPGQQPEPVVPAAPPLYPAEEEDNDNGSKNYIQWEDDYRAWLVQNTGSDLNRINSYLAALNKTYHLSGYFTLTDNFLNEHVIADIKEKLDAALEQGTIDERRKQAIFDAIHSYTDFAVVHTGGTMLRIDPEITYAAPATDDMPVAGLPEESHSLQLEALVPSANTEAANLTEYTEPQQAYESTYGMALSFLSEAANHRQLEKLAEYSFLKDLMIQAAGQRDKIAVARSDSDAFGFDISLEYRDKFYPLLLKVKSTTEQQCDVSKSFLRKNGKIVLVAVAAGDSTVLCRYYLFDRSYMERALGRSSDNGQEDSCKVITDDFKEITGNLTEVFR